MINVLTFSVTVSLIIIGSFWFLHDVLPQILFERKLARTRQLAEESRQKYIEARSNEITENLYMDGTPIWSGGTGKHRRVQI